MAKYNRKSKIFKGVKIAIGADHGGFKLKEKLIIFLKDNGYEHFDFGTYSAKRCDYPKIGYRVACAVASGKYSRGILLCKTGIGFAIVANRIPKVRAALCHTEEVARLSRQHNDSNVLILGANFVKEDLARKILKTWLKTEFLGGRHARRLRQIEKKSGVLKNGPFKEG